MKTKVFPWLKVFLCSVLVVGLVSQVVPKYFYKSQAIPSGYLEFYIPGGAQQVWDILSNLDNDPDLVEAQGLHNVIGVTATLDDSTIYYDHWEDGYDFDEGNPAATADESYVLDQGDVQEFESSNIPVSPRGTATYYDGRDHIFVAGGPVTVTMAVWPESVGTVYSYAHEVYPVKPQTTNYTMPVGVNLASSLNYADFTKVYIMAQALEDNTTVTIDDPLVVGTQVNVVLNKGEVTQYYQPNSGTTIIGSNPIQVVFLNGQARSGSTSQANAFALVPDTLWSNNLYSPVGGFNGENTDLFIYNPNNFQISINYEDTSGTGSFSINADSTKSYQDGAGHFVPLNSGVHLSSTDIFWGIAIADTESANYDWGFSLVPDTAITADYYVGWAPGSSEAVPTVNGSPVFVTPIADDTTIFVDYSPTDGVVDAMYTPSKLQIQKIFDPDKDNTGMHITATNSIVAAWGQDTDTASTGTPYMDMGYTVLPISVDWVDVVLLIEKSADPTSVFPGGGQTSVFTITTSTDLFPVDDVDVVDFLPDDWVYVAGSTTITLPNSSTITGGAADPGISGQTLTWDLNQDMTGSQTLIIEFTGETTLAVQPGFIENKAQAVGTRISGAQVFSPTASAFVYMPAMTIDLDTTTPTTFPNSTATYTLEITNPSTTALTNVTGHITLPSGFTFASAIINETNATRNTITNPSVGSGSPTWGTWTINAGGSVIITTTVNVGGAVTAGTYDATATATSTESGTIDDLGTVAQDTDTPFGVDPEADEDVTVSTNNGSIGDRVWNDLNGNGIDDSEPGISNVTINLISDLNNNGVINGGEPVLSTQTTNGSGAYDFTALAAGNYLVNITDTNSILSGFTLTGGTNPHVVSGLTESTDYNNADFGYQQTNASIGDLVWQDKNGDGSKTANEPGMVNITLDLISDTNGDGDIDGGEPIIATDTTDVNGAYAFTNLPAGNYIVNLTDTALILSSNGFTQTAGVDPHAVTGLTAGQAYTAADFGFQAPQDASIGDTIWMDFDADGVLDLGEPGIANVTVDLYIDTNADSLLDGGDTIVETQTTSASGNYDFVGIGPDTYIVVLTDTNNALTGFTITSGTSPLAINLGISEDFNTADWSYQPPATASIGELVWDDLNGDGVIDFGEPGIANVTVDLYWDVNDNGVLDMGDELLETQATDGTGNYDFINQMPRSYLVDVTDINAVLTDYTQTGGVDPAIIPDLSIGQDYNNANFGFQNQSGLIAGTVWHDVNTDNAASSGDIGISGVSIDLIGDTNANQQLDLGENILATVTTNGSGQFQFTNLIAGSYLIRSNDTLGILQVSGVQLRISELQENPLAVTLSAGQQLTGNDFFYAQGGGRRHRPSAPREEYEPEEEPLPEIIPEPEPNIYMEAELKLSAPSTSDCEGLHPGVKENLAQIFDGEGCNVQAENLCTEDPLMFPVLSDDSCLELVPDRELQFADVDVDDEAYAYIQTLKNTRIISAGDFIASGDGNHSTGKQQEKFKHGEWQFQPDRLVKRVEVVKTALVSNCIPVEDTVPVPNNGFRFKDIPVDPDPNDEVLSFTARVFYTAYKHGIVTGYEDQNARPYEPAKISEIMAFFLRAAHAIPDDYDVLDGPWYQRYMLFAQNNDLLINLSNNPADEMTRRDFAKVIIRVMAYNPNPQIHGYVERVNMSQQIYSSDYPSHRPIPDVQAYLIKPNKCMEAVTSCLMHDSERKLRFSDVRKSDFAADFIDMLRTTKIIPEGDYIASGHGNASTGRQQEKYQVGRWEFQPDRLATRLEVLKMALVANCISIADEIPVPENGFEFRDLPLKIDPKDEAKYFIARVMYTGYIHGIITPDKRRMAKALEPINRIEAITMLIRASKALDGIDRSGKSLPFKDVDQTQWYAKFIEFAYDMGVIHADGDGNFRPKRELQRSEVARLLIQFMGLSSEPGIRSYVSQLFDFYGLHQKRIVVQQEGEEQE